MIGNELVEIMPIAEDVARSIAAAIDAAISEGMPDNRLCECNGGMRCACPDCDCSDCSYRNGDDYGREQAEYYEFLRSLPR